MYKPASTITGLYREDYTYNGTTAAFSKYKDVFREAQPSLSSLSNNNSDSYAQRIRSRRQGVS